MGYKFNPFTGALDAVDSPIGSSGQVIYNNGGALAGISTLTFDGTSVTSAGRLINSYTSLASAPAKVFTGTWFTGGTSTTTKPHFLIEPTGTTSTAWSTSGTGLGVNAASGFAGKLLDLQLNGTSRMVVQGDGKVGMGASSPGSALEVKDNSQGPNTWTSLLDCVTDASFRFKGSNHVNGYGAYMGYANTTNDAFGIQSTNAAGTSPYPILLNPFGGNVGIGITTPGDKLEIGGAGAGIILASPDGTRYRLTVANGGTLSIAAV